MTLQDIALLENEKIGEFWNNLQDSLSQCHNDNDIDPFTKMETSPEEAYVLACMPLNEVIQFLIERNFEINISYNKEKNHNH